MSVLSTHIQLLSTCLHCCVKYLYRLVETLCNFHIQEMTHANNAKCSKKKFPLDVKGLKFDVYSNYLLKSIFLVSKGNCLSHFFHEEYQANGRLKFVADLRSEGLLCFTTLHSEPASALGLTTVWSLWGNLGKASC